MLRLLYVLVLIHLAYGCWRRNDGDDSNNGTVGNGSSTAAPPTTIKPKGKATSSSIRSQLGMELFGLSLGVVCFCFN
ncbi:hypothetical protein SprV_0802629200 [Sparganum proliferum]